MEQNVSFTKTPSDEINLQEVAQILWRSKFLVMAITILIAILAAGYAFFSTPIYETDVQTLPPLPSGLSSYNMGSQLSGPSISGILQGESDTSGTPVLTTDQAYKAFLTRLTSDSIRQEFFNKIYLPAKSTKDGGTKEQLWKRLDSELTITVPRTPNDEIADLTLQGEDPAIVTKWANDYVSMAITRTQKDLLENLSSFIDARKQTTKDQITTLRTVAKNSRQERIARLKDALNVAESIGLEAPAPGSSLIAIGGAKGTDLDAFTDGSMMYLRGSKALQAELAILSKRISDDPYIPELSDLLKKQSLLDNIDLSKIHVSVASIDRPAIEPEQPIKPRKLLIIALGIIFGGMLGIFIVIIRETLKKSKATAT